MKTNPLSRDIRRALDFDAISELERATGISYKDDEGIVWASMALTHEQRKETDALLHLTRDVNSWSQSLEEYTDCLLAMGFKEVLRIPFGGDNEAKKDDEFRVYWNNGVLLAFDTYWGCKSVNGGKMYLNYRGPRKALHQCSNGHIQGDSDSSYVWEVSRDCREGIKFAMEEMREQGEILPTWIKRPFLWLLHYQDTKAEGYDYNKINEERIAMLPQHVREAITP